MKAVMKEDYIKPFATLWKGGEYSISDYSCGYYTMLDEGGDEFVIADFRLKRLADVVEDENLPQKVTVNIWHKDIRDIAEWLYSYHYASIFASIDEAEQSIYRTIYNVLKHQKEALKDNSSTDFTAYGGTAGYHVFFQWQDFDNADIHVYVNPSVAKGMRKGVHVVSEDIDTLLEFYQDYS